MDKKIKSGISVWTIILIIFSIYLIGLSCLEYYASVKGEKVSNQMFEMGQNYSSASFMKMFSQNYTSTESNEWEIAQSEDKIVNLQNEVTDNWYMDTYISWGIRAKMHFFMGLLAIFITIASWRLDKLKKKQYG